MMVGMPVLLNYEPRRANIVRLMPAWLRRALLVAALVVAGHSLLVTTMTLLFEWAMG